jgi:hypothetical protein
MDPYEYKQSIKRTIESLRRQRKNMTPQKARKLLKQLRIWHLLVPNEKPLRATGKK